MKQYLILLLLAMIFIAGCNGVIVNIFDTNTGKLQERIIVTSSMITQDVNGLSVETPNAKVKIDKLSQIYDANAWEKIGNGIATSRTGGLNKLIK